MTVAHWLKITAVELQLFTLVIAWRRELQLTTTARHMRDYATACH